jgi:hypothetical protein
MPFDDPVEISRSDLLALLEKADQCLREWGDNRPATRALMLRMWSVAGVPVPEGYTRVYGWAQA